MRGRLMSSKASRKEVELRITEKGMLVVREIEAGLAMVLGPDWMEIYGKMSFKEKIKLMKHLPDMRTQHDLTVTPTSGST